MRMPTKSYLRRSLLLPTGVAILLGALAFPPVPRGSPPAIGPAQQATTLAPLAQELLDRLGEERALLDQLGARYREAADPALAREIAREIRRVKLGTETDLLRIQLRHARLRGEPATISELEAALHGAEQP